MADLAELIINDHNKVKAIFQQFEQGGDSQKFNQLFTQLYQELTLHSLAEEAVVYPALAQFPDLGGQVKDLFKEQAEVKAIFGELAALDNTSQDWATRINKLMRDVLDHATKEEQQILPMARQMLSQDQLSQLAQDFEKAKQLNMPGVQASFPMKELQMQGGMNTGSMNNMGTMGSMGTTTMNDGGQFVQ